MEDDLDITLYVNVITVKSTGFASTELLQVINIISFIRQTGAVNRNTKGSHYNCNGKTIGKLSKFKGKCIY